LVYIIVDVTFQNMIEGSSSQMGGTRALRVGTGTPRNTRIFSVKF